MTIRRSFNHPIALVWLAFTDSITFKKWWSPKNYACPFCKIDLRLGGRYIIGMKSKEGTELWLTGLYSEIIANEKLTFTAGFSDNIGRIVSASYYKIQGNWPEETEVTIEMSESGKTTQLILNHHHIPFDSQQDCLSLWEESLDKMESMLNNPGKI